MRFCRTTLLVSAISWLMLGMHLPGLYQVTHHGGDVSVTVVMAMVTLGAIAIVSMWTLLRVPMPRQPH